MKKIALVVLLSAALISCKKEPPQKAEQKPQNPDAVVQVGGTAITLSELSSEYDSLPDYARAMFQGENGKERFLAEVVKKEILYQQALKEGLDKDAKFQKKVQDFRKLTLISELLQKQIMAKSQATEQEAKDYYNKNKKDFAVTSKIKASHILVKTEKEAQQIQARLKKGEKFEAIAKEASIDKASAANGGDLGYFTKGEMAPEFERAAVNLNIGEISGPVKTSFGYHIIKVTDRKAGPVVEFDKVKNMIIQRLSGERQKEAFDRYVNELKKNVDVKINKDALAKLSLQEPKQENIPAEKKAPADASGTK